MANVLISDVTLKGIADKVRTKLGVTTKYKMSDVPSALDGLDNTQDATAKANEILLGKTAYVQGEKIEGTINSKSSTDVTVSGATVTTPVGYYPTQVQKTVASGSVANPTVSKSAVSNHSVTITPSVTSTTGYITGSTKSGTSTTVTAADLVSGTETISTNTTTDVTNFKEVTTTVPPLIVTLSVTVPTSGTSTISFSGLPSMPRAWTLDCAQSTANVSWNNLYRCISARYDGTNIYTYTAYKGNQGSATPYVYMATNSGFTQNYSNGTLTFTTNKTGSQTYCGPFLARQYVLMAVCDNDGGSDIYRGALAVNPD